MRNDRHHHQSRRRFLGHVGALAAGTAFSPLLRAADESEPPAFPMGKAEHCIMLWLGGGMAQIDTFDPKRMGDAKASPKKAGAYYPAIDTAVRGVQVCEHLPMTARLMERCTALRTVNHDVIDEHAAAVNRMHTGRNVSGTVVYPSIGSVIAHERGAASDGVPAYVVCGYPNLTRGPGFLGSKHGYIYLTDTESGPAALKRPEYVDAARQARREELLDVLRKPSADGPLGDYDSAVEESLRLSGPEFMRIFDLKEEKGTLRERYGGEFGQRCLLGRRLIESGVRFVEISHNLNFINGTGWDTHNQGQLNQHILIKELDVAFSALIEDLEARKMLDKTLIVISSEFGRPPEFDGGGGRGHQSTAFTCVLAGGGLKHCGAYGETDDLAKNVVSDPVSVPDLFATIHATMGIDPSKVLYDGDRPVPITDGGTPIKALLG
ncbi:MAG: DUF1501 domain-containing protein [Verrucomicrobiales bacterium]